VWLLGLGYDGLVYFGRGGGLLFRRGVVGLGPAAGREPSKEGCRSDPSRGGARTPPDATIVSMEKGTGGMEKKKERCRCKIEEDY